MTFSLHKGMVVMSSQTTHTVINIHPLAHIFDICVLIFSSCASHHSLRDKHQSTRGWFERTQGQAKMSAWNSFSYICTRALHSSRYFAHWRADTAVIPLLPKATFTPSIQPNLGLPRTRPPLTSAIITLLAIRYSFTLSTCPNQLNQYCLICPTC